MANTSDTRRRQRGSKQISTQAKRPSGIDESLGAEIRELRKARGFTLTALADKAGCSASYLSQVERNISTPTISSLQAIAQGLSVNISWFFKEKAIRDNEEKGLIVRADDRRTLRLGSGIVDELLSPHLRGEMELIYSRFSPGSTTGEDFYTHKGEESGIVIAGEIEICIGEEKFLLKEGDSYSFPSPTPHKYSNHGDKEAIIIWAVTPPCY